MCLLDLEAGDSRDSGKNVSIQGCCIFWGEKGLSFYLHVQLVSLAQTSLFTIDGKKTCEIEENI